MREVTAETAAAYLRATGRVPDGRPIVVRELAGGVSNVVLRVDVEGQPPMVLKQCRERLRTRIEWISRLDRIWTEQAAMTLLAEILPAGTVPAIRFEDLENYLYVMECAPEDAVVWKTLLLAGETDPAIARRVGEILGTIHARAVGHPALSGRLAETDLFDQLRVDPYYRQVARVHPDLGPRLHALIASMAEVPRKTLVHADFSPKNMLIHAGGLILIDFETAHAGDPAFDLGFFLSHLLLKAFRAQHLRAGPSQAPPSASPEAYLGLMAAFCAGYQDRAGPGQDDRLISRAVGHAAGCVLARIDGKSPVDYRAEIDEEAVRRFARAALEADAADPETLADLARREFGSDL